MLFGYNFRLGFAFVVGCFATVGLLTMDRFEVFGLVVFVLISGCWWVWFTLLCAWVCDYCVAGFCDLSLLEFVGGFSVFGIFDFYFVDDFWLFWWVMMWLFIFIEVGWVLHFRLHVFEYVGVGGLRGYCLLFCCLCLGFTWILVHKLGVLCYWVDAFTCFDEFSLRVGYSCVLLCGLPHEFWLLLNGLGLAFGWLFDFMCLFYLCFVVLIDCFVLKVYFRVWMFCLNLFWMVFYSLMLEWLFICLAFGVG